MAVTIGAVQKSFVSAIDFLDQPNIDPSIYDQSRDRGFTDIMKIIGRTKPTDMYFYDNAVNNDVWEVGTVSAVTSTGLAQVTFTINTAATFARRGDVIQSSNTNNVGKTARIQSITYGSGTATLTVRSVAGNASPWYATVGDTVQFGSNAFGERSDAPTNRRYGLTKYRNLVQIFREVDEITDVQKVSKIQVNVGGDYHILPYQTLQKKVKLEGDISVAMFSGVQSSTTFADANPFLTDENGYAIQTTGGLDWYITTYGISDSAGAMGTFGFTELDDIIDNFIANKAPNEFMVLCSSKANAVVSKWAKNLGSSGLTSVRMNIDGKSVNLDVQQLEYRGYKFDFVHLPLLEHPQLFSSTLRADIAGSLFIVPKDQIDTLENGQQGRICIRYTPSPFNGGNGSSNGLMKEWRTGALADIPTNDSTYLRTNWYAAQGLECLGVKHFQKYRVV